MLLFALQRERHEGTIYLTPGHAMDSAGEFITFFCMIG